MSCAVVASPAITGHSVRGVSRMALARSMMRLASVRAPACALGPPAYAGGARTAFTSGDAAGAAGSAVFAALDVPQLPHIVAPSGTACPHVAQNIAFLPCRLPSGGRIVQHLPGPDNAYGRFESRDVGAVAAWGARRADSGASPRPRCGTEEVGARLRDKGLSRRRSGNPPAPSDSASRRITARFTPHAEWYLPYATPGRRDPLPGQHVPAMNRRQRNHDPLRLHDPHPDGTADRQRFDHRRIAARCGASPAPDVRPVRDRRVPRALDPPALRGRELRQHDRPDVDQSADDPAPRLTPAAAHAGLAAEGAAKGKRRNRASSAAHDGRREALAYHRRRPAHFFRSMASPLDVVILAAGQGKRMHSALPKVLHHLAGTPLAAYVLTAARALSPRAIAVVVGHGADTVERALAAPD